MITVLWSPALLWTTVQYLKCTVRTGKSTVYSSMEGQHFASEIAAVEALLWLIDVAINLDSWILRWQQYPSQNIESGCIILTKLIKGAINEQWMTDATHGKLCSHKSADTSDFSYFSRLWWPCRSYLLTALSCSANSLKERCTLFCCVSALFHPLEVQSYRFHHFVSLSLHRNVLLTTLSNLND